MCIQCPFYKHFFRIIKTLCHPLMADKALLTHGLSPDDRQVTASSQIPPKCQHETRFSALSELQNLIGRHARIYQGRQTPTTIRPGKTKRPTRHERSSLPAKQNDFDDRFQTLLIHAFIADAFRKCELFWALCQDTDARMPRHRRGFRVQGKCWANWQVISGSGL